MATYVKSADTSGKVNIVRPNGEALFVEASLSETHTLNIEVTDFPVEQGADITDHRRVRPEELRMNGVQSDTPILTQAELQSIGYDSVNPGIVDGAYRFFLDLRDSGDLVSIATKKRNYQNMMMTSLSVPDGPGQSDILDFTVSFKEVRIVQNKTVQVTTRTPGGQATKNKGKQTTTQATPAQVSKSILAKIDDATGQPAEAIIKKITGL